MTRLEPRPGVAAVVGFAGGVAVSACLATGGDAGATGGDEVADGRAEPASTVTRLVAPPAFEAEAGRRMAFSPHFEREVRWDDGGRTVQLVDRELDPATGVWFETETLHSVSFDLSSVRTQLGDELVLWGVARNGDVVLEHWRVPPWDGGWQVVTVRPLTTAGVPNPLGGPPASSVAIAGGGAFVEPTQRGARPTVERTELWRGTALGDVTFVEFDPLGRFVHVLADGPPRLWVIDLHVDDAEPLVVWSDAEWPHLGSADGLVSRWHEEYGRVFYSLHSELAPGSSEFLESLLFDPDDDGFPDSWASVAQDEFLLAFPPAEFSLDGYAWWWVE